MSKWWVVLLVLPGVWAACPNKCSGHGSCGLNDVCQCMQNWVGGDCSGRQCPFTRAWHDTAQRDSDAHYYAECGNRGTCDRTTGECACDDGFVGSGCRRMQCPNDCSGHGTCEFIEELAADDYHKRIAGVSSRKYQLWDQEKIMGCVCDANYEGHDCSLRTCPKGDDPLTPSGTEMKQAVVLQLPNAGDFATTDEFFLTYFDPYGNAYTTEKIKTGGTFKTGGTPAYDDATAVASIKTTCANIQTALQRLPNNVLNTVTVSYLESFMAFTRADVTDSTGKGKINPIFADSGAAAADARTKAICQVTFPSEPGTTGYQYPLVCTASVHSSAGQHPLTAGFSGTCTVSEVYPQDVTRPASGYVADTTAYRPLTELAECSGRGSCDYTTGTCTCFAGHMGLACQKQEALV